jgi:hypothetical protein
MLICNISKGGKVMAEDIWVCVSINIQTTGTIKKIKSHKIAQTGLIQVKSIFGKSKA